VAVIVANFVDGADVGVVESGRGLCFPTKAFQGLRVGGERVGQEFQGDAAEELVSSAL
jgi:hypothetical protein